MHSLEGRRVLVTGGAGVIGMEMVPRLADRGAHVMVGDLKPRPPSFPSAIRYRQGDLNHLTHRELEHFGPEVVIHLAATFERSTETPEFWDDNHRHNVELSHHVMVLSRDVGSVRRVVFASSYLVYDPSLYLFDRPPPHARSLSESDAVRPRNLTGMAKLSHELELRFLEEAGSGCFSTASARIFRGYGRGSRCVVSRWVRALLRGESIDVYRPEGRFDYVFAADSAEGLLRLSESNYSGVVNLGTGRSRTVADVVDCLRERFLEPEARPCESDIPFEASEADTSLFEQVTGWRPAITLEEGIDAILAFERSKAEALSPPSFSVLMTSSSGKVPMLRSVEQAAVKLGSGVRVVAGDTDPGVLTARVADHFWHMPRTEDASLTELLHGVADRGIRAIVPTRDGELEFFARHAGLLRDRGVYVMVSSPESVASCGDKLRFAEECAAIGLASIPTTTSLNSELLGPGPYVVKERFGAGTRGLGLALRGTEAEAFAGGLQEPIFQPFVPGAEVSIDAYVSGAGECKGVVVRTRDEVVDGESRVTTTIIDEEAADVARRLLAHLQIRGHAVVQAIRSATGLRVVECNPRVGGASTLSFAAGLDSLRWFLLEASGADISDEPFASPMKPQRLVRVPTDIIS